MFHIVALQQISSKISPQGCNPKTGSDNHPLVSNRRESPIGEHARKPGLTASLEDRATGFSLIAALYVSD